MANVNVPYTDAESRLALKLWTEGKSATEISKAIWTNLQRRRSRNAVIGFVHRSDMPRRAAAHRRMAPVGTTTERASMAKEKPKVVCVPRATCSKPKREATTVPEPRTIRGGGIPALASRANEARNGAKRKAKKPPVMSRAAALRAVPEPKNLTILEVSDKTCRFPVTDDLPHLFYGHDVTLGETYCKPHGAIVLRAADAAEGAA